MVNPHFTESVVLSDEFSVSTRRDANGIAIDRTASTFQESPHRSPLNETLDELARRVRR